MAFLCLVFPGCLSLSIKHPGTLPWMADHTFGPRLCLAMHSSTDHLLGLLWPNLTSSLTNTDSHYSVLQVLGLINVLRLGPQPNIYINTYYWTHHPYNMNGPFKRLSTIHITLIMFWLKKKKKTLIMFSFKYFFFQISSTNFIILWLYSYWHMWVHNFSRVSRKLHYKFL